LWRCMTEPEVLSPGQALGRYELLSQVARGGMGQVWVARLKGARGFQKLVAIKTLLPELRNDPRIEQMLLEEARIASLIQHQNVVQTTELGENRGYLYLVMEWLDGESLAFVLKRAEERKALPLSIAVNLVAQACRGLHAAHELTNDLGVHLGVVHRDVSPHNILVTHGGVAKLVDFGIAKAMNQDSSFTENGEIKGKYAYMAPEQILGGDVDRRADIFSLGITLYLATTGKHPFKVGDKANVIRAITNDTPAESPAAHVPGYPEELAQVLLKALAKEPEDRFATTEAMRVALEGAVPEAFTVGFEQVVNDYLNEIMGDRAAARREALRRFQLAADERAVLAVASGALPPHGSQSGGSLRAIMVDNVPVEIQPANSRALSQAPTAPGVRPRRRAPWGIAAVGVSLALAAIGFRATRPGAVRATAAPAVAVELPVPQVDPPVRAHPEATGTTPAGATAAPPAVVAAPAASSAAVAVPAPAEAPLTGAPKPASAHPAKKPRKASAGDLMAPEYAK
jgi:hypothetical protein